MTMLLLFVVLVPGLIVACYPLFIRRVLAADSRGEVPLPGNRKPSLLSILVPVRGLEEHPTDNITALLGQMFSTSAEIIFCVESADDPVVSVLEPLLRAHPDRAARLVITGGAGDDLGKMHNLMGGYTEAAGDRLILLDSDVLLPDPEYLDRFVAGLDRSGVGLVTCYPAYKNFRNIPAAIMAFMINNDLLGLFTIVGARGDLPLANGSCMAVTRVALEAAGGLTALRRQLLMDTALARNVVRAGYEVRLHDEGAPVTAGRMTMSQMRQQSRRWHLAMWRVLPRLQYFGYAWLRGGFLLGVVGLVMVTPSRYLAGALAITLAARFLVSWWLDFRYLHSGSFFRFCWLLPLVELINGWDVLVAPLGREVGWRGRSYQVDRRGQVIPQTAMKSWWATLRVGDWGIQLLLLWVGAFIYFLVSPVDPVRYLAHLALVSAWSALFLTAGYLINNYCDRDQDREKEYSEPRVQSDPGMVLAVGVACLVCAAVILVALAPNRSVIMVGAVQIAGGLAYSLPGIRLKERGAWGMLTATTMQRVPGFLMVVLAFPQRPAAAIAITIWFLVMGLVFILEHQLEDLADDKRTGVRTWATVRGRLRTQRARYRLYRIYWMVSLGAAGVILVETPTSAGLFSGLLLAGFSGLLSFLARGRYVGNRSLPRQADLSSARGKEKIIIRGGGLSGLMAAIKLADWGHETEVVQKWPVGEDRVQEEPSVHAVRFDPAYLEEYLDSSLGNCFEPVQRETLYLDGHALPRNSPHWICRRGRGPDTLDGFLMNLARDRGVTFAQVGDLTPSPDILATGLAPDSFESLGLDHTRLSGFRASAPWSGPNILLTYLGDFTHPNYGYVASGGGTIYALIFSRRGVDPAALEVFKSRLAGTEGITFADWRTMQVAVPREPCLLCSGHVLAGTLGGMMDPFWYSGVAGALLSGGLAALALIDPALAQMEHRYFTRNFRFQLMLADVAARLPWRAALVPWIVNGMVDPAGSLGRWYRAPRVRGGIKAMDPPTIELEQDKARVGG